MTGLLRRLWALVSPVHLGPFVTCARAGGDCALCESAYALGALVIQHGQRTVHLDCGRHVREWQPTVGTR